MPLFESLRKVVAGLELEERKNLDEERSREVAFKEQKKLYELTVLPVLREYTNLMSRIRRTSYELGFDTRYCEDGIIYQWVIEYKWLEDRGRHTKTLLKLSIDGSNFFVRVYVDDSNAVGGLPLSELCTNNLERLIERVSVEVEANHEAREQELERYRELHKNDSDDRQDFF